MKARHRAKGGGTHGAQVVSGNKNVIDEAEEGTTGDNDTVNDHKKGGAVKKKKHRATGGKVIERMAGGPVASRGDRPKRASGGGVGANRSPLSTAHGTTSSKGSSNPADSYGGTPK
jgi:hypothetical protein